MSADGSAVAHVWQRAGAALVGAVSSQRVRSPRWTRSLCRPTAGLWTSTHGPQAWRTGVVLLLVRIPLVVALVAAAVAGLRLLVG